MNFSIRHSAENELDLVYLQEESTGTEIAILPGYGASLHAFTVRLKNGPDNSPDGPDNPSDHYFNVIDNYHSLADLKKELSRTFKGPKLSPFACRIAGARYNFEGTEYTFGNAFGDGTAIHGLLYDKPFSIINEEAGNASASLTVEYLYREEDPAYPHTYSCRVRYSLHPGNLLEVETTVTNQGADTLPIADGWHPYFQLGGKIDDWRLQFHADSIVEFNEQLIPTGHLLPYHTFNSPKLIRATFLDNCFVLQPGALHPACELVNPANGLGISFYPDPGYPYLQIYTPPARQSIAIENLSSAPDCFNNKMGLLLLLPGHSQTFTVKYKVNVG
jgi:aldose 1-epimerase